MIKKMFSLKRFYAALLFIAFGLMFIFVPAKYLISVILRAIGIILTLAGIIKLTLVNKDSMGLKEYLFDWIEGVLVILIGVVTFKFYDYKYVPFVCGLIYIITPIIRFIVAKKKINQILVDSLKYLVFLVLISSFNENFSSKIIIAPLFFLGAVFIYITMIVYLVRYKRGVNLNEGNEIIGD